MAPSAFIFVYLYFIFWILSLITSIWYRHSLSLIQSTWIHTNFRIVSSFFAHNCLAWFPIRALIAFNLTIYILSSWNKLSLPLSLYEHRLFSIHILIMRIQSLFWILILFVHQLSQLFQVNYTLESHSVRTTQLLLIRLPSTFNTVW